MLGAAPAAQAARPLNIGFFDGLYFAAEPAERDAWLDRTTAVAAHTVRINIGWPAPNTVTRPPDFDARDPADPQYDFSRADAAIVAARGRGLQVLASFTGAPAWVDGPNRPAGVARGTWKPSTRALEDYGAALARRYSGRFPDPARPGQRLPRVKGFQVWNEPNLSKYLNPQWNGGRTASPALYRRMLSGFYRGVKSVDRRALVVTAGTAPFGDPQPGGNRVQPARFWRELLCLRTLRGQLRRAACPARASFDVLSHHPYSVGQPRRAALNADDVSIPDVRKLVRLLRGAERLQRVLPRKRHPVWVTEISYDSNPPDPDGVPEATHARYLQEAFYLLWRQGVDTITWFQVRDQLPGASFAATSQSGVFFHDGRPKLAAAAFRFPLVTERASTMQLRVWGRSPRAGRLSIQRRVGPSWRTLRTVKVRRNGTFFLRVNRFRAGDRLRARVADETSLVWTSR
ncbi:MAG: hypothetical protein Q8O56_07100 [Solirubrobacteraceae bacterium]|nr:hypothetical protein [Solirubrobacteraceae bacterium]